eukprot:GHVP01060006.1.p1 GENE.GHVP01060006.1~~GHVP01060006.1.p1  ORF type:complete len:344 (+),score=53.23 GHVP01060006.1:129-1160(+)
MLASWLIPLLALGVQSQTRSTFSQNFRYAMDSNRHLENFSYDPFQYLRSHIVEICGLGLLPFVLFSINSGRKKNRAVAYEWISSTQDLFCSEFSKVGFKGSYVIARGWNLFEFFATGRDNCTHIQGILRTVPNQCIWQSFLLRLGNRNQDVIEFEIPIENSMPEMSIIIGKRLDMKILVSQFEEVGECMVHKFSNTPKSLGIQSDGKECMDVILNKSVIDLLNLVSQSVIYLIISDEICATRFSKKKGVLKAKFVLSDEETLEERKRIYQNQVKLMLHLLDLVSEVNLSASAQSEIHKNRGPIRRLKNCEDEIVNSEERKRILEKREKQLEKKGSPKIKTIRR